MSQLTANSLLPLFSALSQEEKLAFAEKVNALVEKPKPKKKRKTVFDSIDPIFWPENHEMLVADIMHGHK